MAVTRLVFFLPPWLRTRRNPVVANKSLYKLASAINTGGRWALLQTDIRRGLSSPPPFSRRFSLVYLRASTAGLSKIPPRSKTNNRNKSFGSASVRTAAATCASHAVTFDFAVTSPGKSEHFSPASCRLPLQALCTSRDGVCVYSRHGSLDGHRIRRNILRLGRRASVCGFAASGEKEVLRWVSQEPPTAGPVADPLSRKGFGGPQGRTALVCAPASHCFIALRAYGRLPPPPPPPALTLLVAVALLLAALVSSGA